MQCQCNARCCCCCCWKVNTDRKAGAPAGRPRSPSDYCCLTHACMTIVYSGRCLSVTICNLHAIGHWHASAIRTQEEEAKIIFHRTRRPSCCTVLRSNGSQASCSAPRARPTLAATVVYVASFQFQSSAGRSRRVVEDLEHQAGRNRICLACSTTQNEAPTCTVCMLSTTMPLCECMLVSLLYRLLHHRRSAYAGCRLPPSTPTAVFFKQKI